MWEAARGPAHHEEAGAISATACGGPGGWARYAAMAPRMEPAVRNGLVGCRRTTADTGPRSRTCHSNACRRTDWVVAVSVASSCGRIHGTDAPASLATSAISG